MIFFYMFINGIVFLIKSLEFHFHYFASHDLEEPLSTILSLCYAESFWLLMISRNPYQQFFFFFKIKK